MPNEMNSSDLHVTAACKLLLEAARSGVEFIFTNLGSDHPAFIEAFATLAASNERMPEIIICPHEMTALSAAHGHALVSRRAQMVLVLLLLLSRHSLEENKYQNPHDSNSHQSKK